MTLSRAPGPGERMPENHRGILPSIATLDVTNQLLRADQDRRLEDAEKAAEWSAQQTAALERLLEQDDDEPPPV